MPRSVIPQCVYGLGTPYRCQSPGIGNPPLCQRHFSLVQNEPPAADEEEDLLQAALGVLMRHLSRPLVNSIRELVDEIKDEPIDPHYAEWPPRPRPRPRPQWNPTSPTPPVSKEPDPRVVMGFGPTDKLTKTLVKRRQRELAALCHPDRGGSEEAMKRINRATEQLLSQLG